MSAAFHVSVFERVQYYLRVLDEQIAAFVLIEPEALVLNPGKPAAKAKDDAAIGNMIEQRHLLGDANRIVPGQHDDARTELHMTGLSRHVREELQDIGTHRVVVEVMLDAPYRVESEWLRPLPGAAAL